MVILHHTHTYESVWKPKIGVWEHLLGEGSQARSQRWWPAATQHHPTAPSQKRREGTGMVDWVSHSPVMARQACSYGQVQGDAVEGQGGDGTWTDTGITAAQRGQGQKPDPRFCCSMPFCGTLWSQGPLSSFISPHFRSLSATYLK